MPAPQAPCLLWGPDDMTGARELCTDARGPSHQRLTRSLWKSQQDPPPRPALGAQPDGQRAGSSSLVPQSSCARSKGGCPAGGVAAGGLGAHGTWLTQLDVWLWAGTPALQVSPQQAILRLRGDGAPKVSIRGASSTGERMAEPRLGLGPVTEPCQFQEGQPQREERPARIQAGLLATQQEIHREPHGAGRGETQLGPGAPSQRRDLWKSSGQLCRGVDKRRPGEGGLGLQDPHHKNWTKPGPARHQLLPDSETTPKARLFQTQDCGRDHPA